MSSSIVRIGIRSLQVVRDIRRLMNTINELEHGLSDRQLSVLIVWHFGRDERRDFNRYILKEISLMTKSGSRWSARKGISPIAYEVAYRSFRPSIPEDLGERMADESRLRRQFYIELDERIASTKCVDSSLRTGDIERYMANGRRELFRTAS